MRFRTIILAAALTLAASTGGQASCNKRPGTPDAVKAVPLTSHSIEFSWRNTTNKSSPNDRHHMWFDIGVGGNAANGKPLGITGGAYQFNFKYHDRSTLVFDGLVPGKAYTFAIKARDEAGTQGCVSDRWSETVTATTFTVALERSCADYANAAIRAVERVKTRGGPAGPKFCQRLLRWPRFTDDRKAHLQFCLFADPQLVARETSGREEDAKKCMAEANPVVVTPGKTGPSTGPATTGSSTACTSTDGSALTAEQQTICTQHNINRDKHGAPHVVWSPTLARNAAAWVRDCHTANGGFCHQTQPRNGGCGTDPNYGYGENLSWGFPSRSATEAVDNWYCERPFYSYTDRKINFGSMRGCTADLNPNRVNGHFTQVIWTESKEIGCAKNTCSLNGQSGTLWACEYNPPGNFNVDKPGVQQRNVLPPK